jgi:hypothetical protein
VSETTTAADHPTHSHRRHWYRLALAATLVLVTFVIVMLPLAIRSMQQVLGRSPDPDFDFVTGQQLNTAATAAAEKEATYINLGLIGLDEENGQITIAVSGNRTCGAACATINLTLTALDNNADQRRGFPPSATITIKPTDVIFSQSVTLPVRGQPSLYPFDDYSLWLGVGGSVTTADKTVEITPDTIPAHAVVTFQNRISDMVMDTPVPIDSQTARSETDPFHFLAVQALNFTRPAYLEVLTVVLVLLIAVSASMALFTRGIDELALGFGSLILGVWGVRSILMPNSLSTATAVDLALTWVILFLLLGLIIRAALHFQSRSELPVPKARRRH